jgi:hypothetical protein
MGPNGEKREDVCQNDIVLLQKLPHWNHSASWCILLMQRPLVQLQVFDRHYLSIPSPSAIILFVILWFAWTSCMLFNIFISFHHCQFVHLRIVMDIFSSFRKSFVHYETLVLQTPHELLTICNLQWLFCSISPEIWDQYVIQNIIRLVYIIKGKALLYNIILWDIQQMHKNVCLLK